MAYSSRISEQPTASYLELGLWLWTQSHHMRSILHWCSQTSLSSQRAYQLQTSPIVLFLVLVTSQFDYPIDGFESAFHLSTYQVWDFVFEVPQFDFQVLAFSFSTTLISLVSVVPSPPSWQRVSLLPTWVSPEHHCILQFVVGDAWPQLCVWPSLANSFEPNHSPLSPIDPNSTNFWGHRWH